MGKFVIVIENEIYVTDAISFGYPVLTAEILNSKSFDYFQDAMNYLDFLSIKGFIKYVDNFPRKGHTKDEMILYWAKQLQSKNLSLQELIENATWLVNKCSEIDNNI